MWKYATANARWEFEVSNGLNLIARCARSIAISEFPIQARTNAQLLSATTFELLTANARSKSSKAVGTSCPSNQITIAAIASVVASSEPAAVAARAYWVD